MAQVTPVIPEIITVHLGAPNSDAENIQVAFPEYIKNVASSEIYPTWPESALRANIYAQISFALNRIYTEWYPSRGYNFDITASPSFDQKFAANREIFNNISVIVDEIFNDYLVRDGSIEPLFAQYCDGIKVTCDGMSQWGTVDLAEEGKTPLEILKFYYGDDISIVENTPVQSIEESYPGTPLKINDANSDVFRIQTQLNKIQESYPAITRIQNVDGVFGEQTKSAVEIFQDVFSLPVTGIVDKATWYKINYIFNSVKKLAELDSEGLVYDEVRRPYDSVLRLGNAGVEVQILQYYLNVLAYFNSNLLLIPSSGIFDDATLSAVVQFQNYFGLDPDGIVGPITWNEILKQYNKTIRALPEGYELENAKLYPGYILRIGISNQDVRDLQGYLNLIAEKTGEISPLPQTGYYGELTAAAVKTLQEKFDLDTTGSVGPATWFKITEYYNQLNR